MRALVFPWPHPTCKLPGWFFWPHHWGLRSIGPYATERESREYGPNDAALYELEAITAKARGVL